MDVNEIARTAELYPPASTEPVIVEREYVDDEDPSVSLAWRINDVPTADWALARMAALQREVADVEAQKEAAIARIEARAAKLTEKAQHGIGFFESRLAEYANRERRSLLGGGKRKSRELLNGTIGWRKTGGRLVITDKTALVAWLETQPPEGGLYRIRVEPEMRAIQEQFKASGIVPPGCDFAPEEEEFFVKVPETAIEVCK